MREWQPIECSVHMVTTEEWFASAHGREMIELRRAITSRVLSVAELRKVGEVGYRLLVTPNQTFNAEEKQREFQAMLSIQHMLQIAAARESENITAGKQDAGDGNQHD